MKKATFRSATTTVHLWLGLASGPILFIVCLTGTIYTFRAEIERLLHPSRFYVAMPPEGERLPADSLVGRLGRELKGKVVSLNIPQDPERSYQVGVRMANAKGDRKEGGQRASGEGPKGGRASKDESTGGGHGPQAGKETPAPRPKTFYVNPYTGAVLGSDGDGSSKFFATTLQLHRWLLMESSGGRIIVGVATLIFLFIILSGLVIWFPVRIKYWKQGLQIRLSAGWKRINHDLHNALGFYSSIFLLVMALTGLCWSFEWYRNGASSVLGAKVFGARNEKALLSKGSDGQKQALFSLLATADETFPYDGDYRVTLATDSAGSVTIAKNKTGFFALSASDRLILDQYSGKALKVDRFSDKKWNEQVAGLIRPLHTGEIFGTFSKIIYFLACLIATSLPITGTLIWLNKRKKKPVRRTPAPAIAASASGQYV